MSEARSGVFSPSEQINNLELLLEDKRFTVHQDTLGLLNYYIAFRYNNLGNYVKVIQYSSNAIKAFRNSNYVEYQYPTSLLMRAKSNLSLGDIDDAIYDFEYIINEVPISGRGYRSLNEAFQKRSLIYRMQGEYESAIHNINSFVTTSRIDSVNLYGKSIIYLELSIAHAMKGGRNNLFMANEAIEKAMSFYSDVQITNDFDLEQKVLNIMHQAFISRELGASEEAVELYTEALALLHDKISIPKFNNLMVVSMINLSQLFLENKRCEEALESSLEASKLFSQTSNPKYIETESELFLVTAESYLCLGNNEKAQEYLNQGEALLLKNEALQSALYLRQYVYKDFLIQNKISQLKVEYKFDDNIYTLLNKAEFIDSLIGFYLEDMYFNSSKIELKSELDEFYKLALDIAFENNDIDKFWNYSEKRSNVLVLGNENYDTEDQADNFEIELSNLKRRASDIENQLFAFKDNQHILRDSVEKILADLKYEQLSILEKRSKFGVFSPFNVISLSEFSQNLDRDKTWINYQFGTEYLYALKVSDEGDSLIKLDNTNSVKHNIQTWFSAVSLKQDNAVSMQQLNRASNNLFEALISPLDSIKQNLIIIPDEELYYVSFEALQSSSGKYLIEDNTISYNLSGTLVDQHGFKNSAEVNGISIFLPSYEQSYFTKLSYVYKDIESVKNFSANVNIYENNQTTKSNFISAMIKDDIVHFGGHAIHVDENNQYSHLALTTSDESNTNIISLGDLYANKINSHLVVLPSCNTGMGSILKGEGISNLTRGFFYGGAESVMSSLWEVDDKSTSQIVNDFYVNMKSGMTKSASLRKAKLKYLNSSPDFLKHPNLWSGLVLTGNDSAMSFSNNYLILIVIIFMLFICSLYFIRSKKASR